MTPGPDLDAALRALDGLELPGGCDRCQAVQRLTTLEAGVHRLEILHDATCRELRRRLRQARRRGRGRAA